ncbi:tripartite tricarboxylate transporter permease [Treponema parvum]|uniref:Tripartite tricarboxylate transporter permease n=1 Tax=Treponema parvum TaxID=138851 RepID=A0A975F1A7_9SPIR|nr:tripartite tricarboxylate transporter permease [Treponema parvum]QTQ12617.1 tripartite tricarboxylate transporter permease [Treponema parvum]
MNFIVNIVCMSFAVFYGIIFGAIPGLTSSVAVALLIPLTFGMDPTLAINVLIAVYVGGVSGGLISAILLRIPGTPSSIMTTFDGYPMAQSGRAGIALGLAIISSFIGGIFSSVMLLFLSPLLAKITIAFSPFDYFGITVFSLSLVSMLIDGNPLKGLIATLLGILFSFFGTSPIDGRARFTFGNHDLDNGFNVITVIIGVFAISEMLSQVGNISQKNRKAIEFSKKDGFFPKLKEMKYLTRTFLRSSVIGTIIGILPGLSGPEAALISYSQAKRTSKEPEKFGKGSMEGLAASETSNNAVSGGALIPMLALGIPGNAVTAIIMGGLTLHGVEVGPLLFGANPELIRNIIIGIFIANVLMLIIESFAIKGFVKILAIPKYFLYPLIIVFCVVGVSSVNNRSFDCWGMLFFGILGYVLEKNKYPLGPLILGFILGSIIELNFRRSIMAFGSLSSVLTNNVFRAGTVFLILAIIIPVLNARYNKKAKKRNDILNVAKADIDQGE